MSVNQAVHHRPLAEAMARVMYVLMGGVGCEMASANELLVVLSHSQVKLKKPTVGKCPKLKHFNLKHTFTLPWVQFNFNSSS